MSKRISESRQLEVRIDKAIATMYNFLDELLGMPVFSDNQESGTRYQRR